MSSSIIPFEMLESHFKIVEDDAVAQAWVRVELLNDARQKPTLLAHLLLEYHSGLLSEAGHGSDQILWTRFYWLHRLKRMHEVLEHGGEPCPAQDDLETGWFEDAGASELDWEQLEPIEIRAERDAENELGVGPHLRPAFACGDIRELAGD